MKNKKLLYSAIVALGITTTVFAWENPVQKYNLYADTHNKETEAAANGNYEQGMTDYYSGYKSLSNNAASIAESSSESSNYFQPVVGGSGGLRRNDDLRESSKKVFADKDIPPAWMQNSIFYTNPKLDSIIQKYKKSNFTGCMQEAEAYVKKHPEDTLGYYYLAMSYSKIGDKENAIKAYEKVIELNDNPMIVKYATNGRNCVMGGTETCYPDVNKPDLLYPYANVAETTLTPVDPKTLIERNIVNLEEKLSPTVETNDASGNPIKNAVDGVKNAIEGFSQQDSELDKFIKAPYGTGLDPKLQKENKQIQLNKFKQEFNSDDDSYKKQYQQKKEIKEFDRNKSDNNTIKLAYDISQDELDKLSKDPQYLQTEKELQELRMMLGSDISSSDSDDIMDLLNNHSKDGQKLTPEMIQSIMVKEMMPDFMFINTKDVL